MPLAAGVRLGPYEIQAAIGAGGMGEVWRARDSRLDREVAIKILPEAFATDPDRLTRFEREAKALAALNHPNVATIYGLERLRLADDVEIPGGGSASASSAVMRGETVALVMELVEGEDLSDRIDQGALPLEEALSIGRQIAEALEAAHEHGIIHRDLKPANVKVKPDGTVKVLDFGLAKTSERAGVSRESGALTQSPTITSSAMTAAGVLLGTAAYMAPEQARGEPVDKRADIWAFGVVLYEMLTGRQAFPGRQVAEQLVGVLERGPDFRILPVDTPPRVRLLLRRCLAKDSRERLRDIGDARIELRETGFTDGAEMPTRAVEVSRRSLALALAASIALAAVGALGWGLRGTREATSGGQATRLELSLPLGQEGTDSLASSPVLISPDGRTLVYATGTTQGRFLYRRSLDTFEAVKIPGTKGAESPFFSFDGQWIGFQADNLLKKVPVAGGEPVQIAPAPVLLLGADWGPDDTIVFSDSRSTGLWRVSAAGGTPESLSSPRVAMAFGHRFPYVLPNGRGVLFFTARPGDQAAQLAFLPFGSDEWRGLRMSDTRMTGMRYLPTGHLVYGQNGTIFAAPFDPDRVALTGEPRPVVSDVASSPISQYVSFAVSDTGTLVYLPVTDRLSGPKLVRVAADGGVEEIADLAGATDDRGLRLSPDGNRVAVASRTAGVADVWTYGLDRGDRRRATQGAEVLAAIWRSEGQDLTIAMRGDLYDVAADGSGEPTRLLQRQGVQTPLSWSSDGRVLLFSEARPDTGVDLFTFAPASGVVAPIVQTPANEVDGVLSPNGRSLAYVSDETGRREVYLTALDGSKDRQAVSIDGGDTPEWSADGSALFFRDGGNLMRVSVATDPFRLNAAEVVLSAPDGMSLGIGYGVRDDGVVIGVRNRVGAGEPTELRIVLNWFDELRRLVPTS